MKKRVFAALMAGVMGTMMFGTTFVSADAETPELKGEVYAFIAASLNNAMEEIQMKFNETYPDVEILYNADSSGTLQTQIEEGARCDIFFSAARKQMDALFSICIGKFHLFCLSLIHRRDVYTAFLHQPSAVGNTLR